MRREYASAKAFRRALEDRLRKTAEAEQIQLHRLRRRVAFDRLLARLFRTDPAPWFLKGGYALELRFRNARGTLDIDLTVPTLATDDDAGQALRDMLQEAAGSDLRDWFDYTIGPPVLDLNAAPYGGARFHVQARMDGRIFARFHLDAGIGDAAMEPLDSIECQDWLGFAGIGSPVVRAISREQQFAEKVHAYTLPRSLSNSRVKDFVDLALLTGSGQLALQRAADALRLTFARRKTHAMPTVLHPPPADWVGRFCALAEECALPANMDAAFAEVRAFFDRIVSASE